MKNGKAKRKKPSREAAAAAPRIRNSKAELLDTITAQHTTILQQTEAMRKISDRWNDREARLRLALQDLLMIFDDRHAGGLSTAEVLRLNHIREIAK